MKNNNFAEFDKEIQIREITQRQHTRKRIDYILKIYSRLGVLIGIIGIVIFVIDTFDITFDYKQRFALMIAGSGFFLSILSWVMLKNKNENKNNDSLKAQEYIITADFLSNWKEFEEISSAYLLSKDAHINDWSIREILFNLQKHNILTPYEIRYLNQAMQIRNDIVHEQITIPIDIITKYTDIVGKIIEKIALKSKHFH